MALECAHGTIEWLTTDVATTTYTVSGLAFQPKAIMFWWVGIASAGADAATQSNDQRMGVGFATSTSNRCAAIVYDDDAALTSDAGSVAADDCVCGTLDNAAARDAELDLNSITSDGFTLIVDDQLATSNITVHWMAWGGSDITVATCGSFAEPSSATTVTPTVTGFTSDGANQVVMFGSVQSSSAINTAHAENGGLSIGFCTGTAAAEEWCIAGSDDHNSATADTDGIGGTGKVTAQAPRAGGTAFVTSNLTAWGTDNFTVTYAGTVVTDRKTVFLAIKGGRWAAGGYTIAGNTGSATATVSSLPFTPIGVIIGGCMKTEDTAATGSVQDRLSLGFGTSTSSRKAQGHWSEDDSTSGSSAVEINQVAEYDSVLAFPSNAGALAASYDINAMNADGFQIIVDTAGGVASEWQGYLAFGNPVAKTGSESLAVRLTETATAEEPVFFAKTGSESLPNGLTESATAKTLLSVGESLGVTVSDADILNFEINPIDSTRVTVDDAATLDTGGVVGKTGSDSLTVGVTEATVVLVTQAASDSPAVGMTETSVTVAAFSGADDPSVSIMESSSAVVAFANSDDLAVTLTETATPEEIAATPIAGSESLRAGLNDESTVLVAVGSDDSVTAAITESATPEDLSATPITASDAFSVLVTETDITNFELAIVDSVAVGLTESSALDTGGATPITGSESLLAGVSEDAIVLASVISDESSVVGASEDSAIVAAIATDDSLTIAVTESATADQLSATPITASDDLPIVMDDVATLQVLALTDDSLVAALTELGTLAVFVATSDDLAVGLTESSALSTGDLTTVTASDTLSVVVAETDITAFELNVVESLAIGLTEASSLSGTTNTDTCSVGVTETATIAATVTTSDSLTVTALDPSAYDQAIAPDDDPLTMGLTESATAAEVSSGSITASESLTIGLTEASVTVIACAASDDLAVQSLESASVSTAGSETVAATDSLAMQILEATDLGIAVLSDDALSVQVSEVASLAISCLATDESTVQIAEQATAEDLSTGLTTKTAADSLTVTLDDIAAIAAAGSATDDLPAGVDDAAVVLAYIATSDSISVAIADESQAVQVVLSVTEALPVGLAEETFARLVDQVQDGAAAVLDEAVAILASFAAQDDGAVLLTEASTVELVGGLALKTASDDVAVSLTESGVVVMRVVGALSVLRATAEYLGETREVDYNGTRNTVHSGTLPYEADVLAVQE